MRGKEGFYAAEWTKRRQICARSFTVVAWFKTSIYSHTLPINCFGLRPSKQRHGCFFHEESSQDKMHVMREGGAMLIMYENSVELSLQPGICQRIYVSDRHA